MQRLTTAILTAIWNVKRGMRCAEAVLAILSEPLKVHPWAVTIVQALIKARRILSKLSDRLAQSGLLIQQARKPDMPRSKDLGMPS